MGFLTSHSSTNDNSKIPDIKDSTPYRQANTRYTLSLYGELRIKGVHFFQGKGVKREPSIGPKEMKTKEIYNLQQE